MDKVLWVCEYSPVQDALHVDTLKRVLAINRKTAGQGKAPGYIPLFLGTSSAEAHAFATRWRREHPWKEAGR